LAYGQRGWLCGRADTGTDDGTMGRTIMKT